MLLLDENISHKLIKPLNSNFEGIKHIKEFAATGTDDNTIWEIARKNNLTIVTFDSDYEDILSINGFPPKIIWFRFGNTSTNIIANTLLHHSATIFSFIQNNDLGILEINEAIF
jgi:predicted nuclease of predicted toxin-antitoxin system